MYNPSQTDSPTTSYFSPEDSPGKFVSGDRTNFGGGSAIGSAISTIGGLIDNWRNRVHERKMQKLQMEENEKNKKWQEEMYNKYESPQAQAQAMKSAGLNPAGQVSSQSVGSASSSPLPQGQPSSIGAALTGGINMYLNERRLQREYKLAERKQISDELSVWQNHILDEIRLGMDEETLNAQKLIWKEELDNWKLTNKEKSLYVNWLESIDNEGINPTKINIQKTLADITHLQTQDEFIKAQTATENDLREGKVTAQTLANMSASFEYRLREKYGDKLADLDYRQFKETVERDERLREIYVHLAKNQQAKAFYESKTAELTYNDLLTLPPWQRYMLNLGKEVVAKGADLVF